MQTANGKKVFFWASWFCRVQVFSWKLKWAPRAFSYVHAEDYRKKKPHVRETILSLGSPFLFPPRISARSNRICTFEFYPMQKTQRGFIFSHRIFSQAVTLVTLHFGFYFFLDWTQEAFTWWLFIRPATDCFDPSFSGIFRGIFALKITKCVKLIQSRHRHRYCRVLLHYCFPHSAFFRFA